MARIDAIEYEDKKKRRVKYINKPKRNGRWKKITFKLGEEVETDDVKLSKETAI